MSWKEMFKYSKKEARDGSYTKEFRLKKKICAEKPLQGFKRSYKI